MQVAPVKAKCDRWADKVKSYENLFLSPCLILHFASLVQKKISHSTTLTWMSTPGWLSEYVVKVCVCLVGMVVLRLMREVMTPPAVSIPRDSGATSSSSRSCTSSDLSPDKMAACTAGNSEQCSVNKLSKYMYLFASLAHANIEVFSLQRITRNWIKFNVKSCNYNNSFHSSFIHLT